MKGLKKLALATAVAAAPFAQAELTAMDDALLEEMTGQAGITIDVDLQMTIDAIKYVDEDGIDLAAMDLNGDGDTLDIDEAAVTTGAQGAITAKSIQVGSFDTNGALVGAAQIRGVTIDADGSQGLTIGLGKIGDTSGNGIDVSVAAILINNGNANLNNYEAVQTANAGFVGVGNSFTYNNMIDQTATGVAAAVQAQYTTAATDYATDNGAAYAATSGSMAGTYSNASDVYAAAAAEIAAGNPGDGVADLAILQGDAGYNNANETAMNVALNDATVMQTAAADIQSQANGNVGGIRIDNFRNYIQNSLVEEYNARFDMALGDSDGAIAGVAGSTATGGRYVKGEIIINGTGNYAAGTAGLQISGKFGGAMDKAAWVDDGGEFGVADMGFFHGVDKNLDGISDTIEGMHFSVNIDVVDRASSITGANVAQLAISDMQLQGTIMMGDIYLATDAAGNGQTSLGSVLVKDIDMTGTTVYIYGH